MTREMAQQFVDSEHMERRIDSSLNTIALDLALFIMEEDDNYAVADGRIVFIAEE